MSTTTADSQNATRQPQRQECRVGQRPGQDQQHDGGEHVADRHGGLRPAGPEAARLVRAVLGDQQHRAAPFAADGEALDEPQHDQQGRRPVADLPERRQAAHQERRDADEHEAELEQLLAAELVAEVAEHHAADRPGDEADRVGDEGRR